MLPVAYLLSGALPPLIVGPLAGWVYVLLLRREKSWPLIPFWALLTAANLAIAYWLAASSNDWFAPQSLMICMLTPVAAIATVLVMRLAWRRTEPADKPNQSRRGWFIAGLGLIPAVQLGIVLAEALLAPWFCQIGWLVCRDW